MTNSNAALPKRQHPISILFFIGRSIKDMLYPLLAFLISTVLREDVNPLWFAAGVAVFLTITVTLGILTWARYSYMLDHASIHVTHGLFIRKNLSVPRERVQSIDMSAGLLQRLFGVVKLQIETAGGRKPEVVLSAVEREEAERIRTAMYREQEAAGPHAVVTSEPYDPTQTNPGQSDAAAALPMSSGSAGAAGAAPDRISGTPDAGLRLSLGQLLLYSATSGRAFLALAVLGALFSQADDLFRDLFRRFDVLDAGAELAPDAPSGWILLGAAVLFVLWLIGVFITTAKEYGFTVTRSNGKLLIRRGLLEKKQLSVSLNRIQAVHVKQNAVRRLLGYASVNLVTAVATEKEGATQSLLCPLVSVKELPELLTQFLPGYQWPEALERLDRRSAGGYLILPAVLACLAAIPGLIWIPYGLGWTALALPAIVLWWSWLRYRATGWTANGRLAVIRYGGFGIHTALIPRRRIQWLRTSVSPMQARRRLTTLRVSLASGALAASYSLRHIPMKTGAELLETMRGRQG